MTTTNSQLMNDLLQQRKRLKLQETKLKEWRETALKNESSPPSRMEALDQIRKTSNDYLQCTIENNADRPFIQRISAHQNNWYNYYKTAMENWNHLNQKQKHDAEKDIFESKVQKDYYDKAKQYLNQAQQTSFKMNLEFLAWIIHCAQTKPHFVEQFLETYDTVMELTDGGMSPILEFGNENNQTTIERLDEGILTKQEEQIELDNDIAEEKHRQYVATTSTVSSTRFTPSIRSFRTGLSREDEPAETFLSNPANLVEGQHAGHAGSTTHQVTTGDHSAAFLTLAASWLGVGNLAEIAVKIGMTIGGEFVIQLMKIFGTLSKPSKIIVLIVLAGSAASLYGYFQESWIFNPLGILPTNPLTDLSNTLFSVFGYGLSFVSTVLSLRDRRSPAINPLAENPCTFDFAARTEENRGWMSWWKFVGWAQMGLPFIGYFRKKAATHIKYKAAYAKRKAEYLEAKEKELSYMRASSDQTQQYKHKFTFWEKIYIALERESYVKGLGKIILPLSVFSIGAYCGYQFLTGRGYMATQHLLGASLAKNTFDNFVGFFTNLPKLEQTVHIPFDPNAFFSMFASIINQKPELAAIGAFGGFVGEMVFSLLVPYLLSKASKKIGGAFHRQQDRIDKNVSKALVLASSTSVSTRVGQQDQETKETTETKTEEEIKNDAVREKHQLWSSLYTIIGRFMYVGAQTLFWQSFVTYGTGTRAQMEGVIDSFVDQYIPEGSVKIVPSFAETCAKYMLSDKYGIKSTDAVQAKIEELGHTSKFFNMASGYMLNDMIVTASALVVQTVIECYRVCGEELTNAEKDRIISDVAKDFKESKDFDMKQFRMKGSVAIMASNDAFHEDIWTDFQETQKEFKTTKSQYEQLAKELSQLKKQEQTPDVKLIKKYFDTRKQLQMIGEVYQKYLADDNVAKEFITRLTLTEGDKPIQPTEEALKASIEPFIAGFKFKPLVQYQITQVEQETENYMQILQQSLREPPRPQLLGGSTETKDLVPVPPLKLLELTNIKIDETLAVLRRDIAKTFGNMGIIPQSIMKKIIEISNNGSPVQKSSTTHNPILQTLRQINTEVQKEQQQQSVEPNSTVASVQKQDELKRTETTTLPESKRAKPTSTRSTPETKEKKEITTPSKIETPEETEEQEEDNGDEEMTEAEREFMKRFQVTDRVVVGDDDDVFY